MSKVKKEMEGGYRLENIRKMRKWLYAVQLVIVLVFAVLLMEANGELTVDPMHIGIPSFLYFVLIMLIIIQVESFIFLRLETRFIRSPSTKYYMTRDSVRRSYYVIIVAVIFLLLFALPFMNSVVKDVSTSEKVYNVSGTPPVAIVFTASDMIGMTQPYKLSVDTNGPSALVFLVSEENYKLYANLGADKLAGYRVNTDIYEAYPGMEYTMPELAAGRYYICIYSTDGGAVTAQVTTVSEISPHLAGYVPLLCLIFIAANVIWILYVRSIIRVFEQRAIYR